MKICWDNLDIMEYHEGDWRKRKSGGGWVYFVYIDSCPVCGEPFLADRYNHRKGKLQFCHGSCRMKWQHKEGKVADFSGKNNPMYGRKHTDVSKIRMSENRKGADQ